ncbi:MAG: hypothetical protein LLG16_09325 [Euryarchaeota archaeon]|nr:hypothetical protein [Euryarchaeota archaeon]
MAFIFFNVITISTAKLVRSPMKELSYILGAIGISFVFVMFVSDAGIVDLFGPAGHGGTERMIVYQPITWLASVGGYLMASGAENK